MTTTKIGPCACRSCLHRKHITRRYFGLSVRQELAAILFAATLAFAVGLIRAGVL